MRLEYESTCHVAVVWHSGWAQAYHAKKTVEDTA
jgi:hypothetical protein